MRLQQLPEALKLLDDPYGTERLGSVEHFMPHSTCLIEIALAHEHVGED